MAENEKTSEIKEYAGGWISERKNTDVPTFLKYAYIVITLGCVGYAIRFMNGAVGDTERGRLVEQFNQVTQHSNLFMYIVAAMALLCGLAVAVFAFRKFHED